MFHQVVQALERGPVGTEKLLVDNLNAYLAQLRDQREEDLRTAIAYHNILDQSQNFILRLSYRGEDSWS